MHVLITAGPTREPLDEVRFISNRSSGAMGFALARAAKQAGHEVTLLLGPVQLPLNLDMDIEIHRFATTADLEALLWSHFPRCDVLIKAAAVADYRPVEVLQGKTPRKAKGENLTITLAPTPDLVAGCAAVKREDQRIIAYALEEPASLFERATSKMQRKQVDAIVANPLQTMDAQGIHGVLLYADGRQDDPGVLPKDAFATWLVERLSSV